MGRGLSARTVGDVWGASYPRHDVTQFTCQQVASVSGGM